MIYDFSSADNADNADFFLLFSPQSTRSSTEFSSCPADESNTPPRTGEVSEGRRVRFHPLSFIPLRFVHPLVILTTEGRKDLGNTHYVLYFSLSLIQRKDNKRKIKCYGSVAIRVKPLVNGT